MKVNLTKKLVENQYPDIFKDLKFKGDLDKANVYLDIAVAINNKHIGRDEFSSEKEYWLENYKNGVVFISLVVSEGKKKTLIEAKKLTSLFDQYGLPVEFVKDEPEKKYETSITFKVPKWSSQNMPVHLSRTLISVGALALSGGGLIAALFGLAMVKGVAAGVILLVWLAAFSALTRMLLAWIRDTELGEPYSQRAFLLGCSSLLALPLATLPESLATDSGLAALMRFTTILLFEIVVSLPAIVLAWHLNKFHSGRVSR